MRWDAGMVRVEQGARPVLQLMRVFGLNMRLIGAMRHAEQLPSELKPVLLLEMAKRALKCLVRSAQRENVLSQVDGLQCVQRTLDGFFRDASREHQLVQWQHAILVKYGEENGTVSAEDLDALDARELQAQVCAASGLQCCQGALQVDKTRALVKKLHAVSFLRGLFRVNAATGDGMRSKGLNAEQRSAAATELFTEGARNYKEARAAQ